LRLSSRTLLATVAADVLALVASFALAYHLHFFNQVLALSPQPSTPGRYLVAISLLAPLWLVVYLLNGLYSAELIEHGTGLVVRAANASMLATLLSLAGAYLTGSFLLSRGWIMTMWPLALVLTTLARRLLLALRRRWRYRRPWRVLIIGASEVGLRSAEALAGRRDIRVVGVLDDFLPLGSVIGPELRVIGRPTQAHLLAASNAVDELLLVEGAVPQESYDRLLLASFTTPKAPPLRLIPNTTRQILCRLEPAQRGSVAILLPELRRDTGVDKAAKALLDRSVAVVLLTLTSPLFLATWLWSLAHHRSWLHGTVSMGLGGRRFRRWSFASWWWRRVELSGPSLARHSGPDAWQRDWTTSLLRALPRAINVLTGEMSLVGPRPFAEPELPLYGEWAGLLLAMKPGLFGPWLLEDGSELTEEQELITDLTYVRDYTLAKDLMILLVGVTWLVRRLWSASRPRRKSACVRSDSAIPTQAHANGQYHGPIQSSRVVGSDFRYRAENHRALLDKSNGTTAQENDADAAGVHQP